MTNETKNRVKDLLHEIIDVVADEDGGKGLDIRVLNWAEEAEKILKMLEE